MYQLNLTLLRVRLVNNITVYIYKFFVLIFKFFFLGGGGGGGRFLCAKIGYGAEC